MTRINPYKLFYGLLVPNWLACRSELNGTTKLIYGRLIQFAGEQGVAYPAIETLANAVGVSNRVCKAHLKLLKDAKLIDVERIGLGKTNRYYFLDHTWLEVNKTSSPASDNNRKEENFPSREEENRPTDGKNSSPLMGKNLPHGEEENFPLDGKKSSPPIKGRRESEKENHNKQSKKENHSNHSVAYPRQQLIELTQKIFNFWKEVMKHPRAKLDDKRRQWIQKALKMGYSLEDLQQAISGCSYTPHNMGQNDQNQRYDGLHIILKNADQIDRFISNYHQPPKLQTKAEQRTYENLQSTRDWLKQKLSETNPEEGI